MTAFLLGFSMGVINAIVLMLIGAEIHKAAEAKPKEPKKESDKAEVPPAQVWF